MASCLVLSGVAPSAHAAGLGRINVFSALGQPLRAEIELSATRDELSGLRAGLASAEAFRQAGLDLPSNLLEIKFSVDRRPDGRAVIKLSSDRPINDPFIDMLLEINWPAGRLVREYTFLLDPPEVAAKAAAPVSAPVAPAAARAPAKPTEAVARPAVAEPAGAAASGERQVKRGETLRRIAEETRPEGVSLEQMLVGLFRANQEAFDGGNINRLKAGRILSIPEKEALESVSDTEAKKIVVAHAADWNAYRRKLAGVAAQASAAETGTRQAAEGRITPKVEDQAAPAAAQPKDQVKVATAEKPGAKGGGGVSSEDLLAKEKALQEANARLAMLEKNVAELQKLIELKNQSLAELQKQAAAASAPVAAAPKAVEPSRPVEAPKAVEPAKAPEPAEPPKAIEPPAAEPPKPADAVPAQEKPAEAEAPKADAAPPADVAQAPKVEDAPPPKPKPVLPPPPPPEPEPSFLAELLGSPAMLAGGGGILALLAGYAVYKRRRESKGEAPLALATTLSQPGTSLTANSVFRTTGGQSVDTSHTPAQTDFSQAGPGSIDTDEVDPVAEADVYMAYGRDAQAEEILLEARQKDPKRLAIVLKLLEIYANRKSVKQFETLATDLYGETGGVGADWEKAAALGLKIDPQNPLYGGGDQAAAADGRVFDPDATLVVSAGNLKNTVTMPGQLAPLAAAATAAAAATLEIPAAAPVESAGSPVSLDFDLGVSDATAAAEPEPVPLQSLNTTDLPAAVAEADTLTLSPGALDFDLGIPEVPSAPAATPVAAAQPESPAALDFNLPEISLEPAGSADATVTADALDFDLGVPSEPVPTAQPAAVPDMVESVASPDDAALEPASLDEGNLEFDVQLTESTVLGQPMRDPAFDMASISLDLAETPPAELPAQADARPEQGFAESETVVNPDFSSEQVDTLVNPDFTITQAETVVDPGFGMTSDVAPDLQISASEEVATKLDLAKAYEEMGDLEGARELLQEVVSEGDAGQRERAQTALARIGG